MIAQASGVIIHVTSIQREYRSVMPSSYALLLSERELTDLLAYLGSLRGDAR